MGSALAEPEAPAGFIDEPDAPEGFIDEPEAPAGFVDEIDQPSPIAQASPAAPQRIPASFADMAGPSGLAESGKTLSMIPGAIAETAATTAQGLLYGAEVAARGNFPALNLLNKQLSVGAATQAPRDYLRNIQERSMSDYGVSAESQKGLIPELISGGASILPVLAAGPLAPIAAAGLMGESGRQEAEAAGATPEKQQAAFGLNAALGVASEALLGIPAMLRGAKAAGATVKGQIVAGAAREGAQEAIEQAGGNVIAGPVVGYDPNRELMQGVGKAALLGAAIGAPVGGGITALANADARRARQAAAIAQNPTVPATAAASAELGPEATPPPIPGGPVRMGPVAGDAGLTDLGTPEGDAFAGLAPATAQALREAAPNLSPMGDTTAKPATEGQVTIPNERLQEKGQGRQEVLAPVAPSPEPTPAAAAPAAKAGELPPLQSPVRENKAQTSIVLPNGDVVVGGRFHGETFEYAEALGAATGDELSRGVASFTTPDGRTWNLQGTDVPHGGKVIDLAALQQKQTKPTPAAPAAPEPAPAPLALETQTPQSIDADKAAADLQAKAKAQREQIAAKQQAPLTGNSEDVGQGALFAEGEDLFSGMSAEQMRQMEDEARQKSEQDTLSEFEQQQAEDNPEILDVLDELGGLPAVSARGKGFGEELQRIKEASKGAALRHFRKTGKSLDDLRQMFNERGFDFETPYDMLAAIEARLATGKKKYGTKAVAMQMPYGPGKMTEGELGPQKTMAAYNAAVIQAAKDRGGLQAELPQTVPQPTGEETHATIEAKIEADPELPQRTVDAINNGTKKVLSTDEQAIVRWHLNDLTNKLEQEQERLADPSLTEQEQVAALERANDYSTRLAESEQANTTAGSAMGGAFRERQNLINSDFTFGGRMRVMMNNRGGRPLTPSERATAAAQAKEIQELQEKQAETEAKLTEAETKVSRTRALESTIADLQKAEAARPKYGQAILDRAEKIVTGLEKKAEASTKFLHELLGRASSGPDPTIVYHVGVKLAAKVGRFGLDKLSAFAEMIAEFGAKIEPHLEPGWKAMHKIIGSSTGGGGGVRKIVEEGVSKPAKGEITTEQASARARVEADKGMKLGHKTAYEAVRSVLNSGVKGEDAVMNASLELLREAYPDLTANELDVKFSDYGNAKYPSEEAVKVELAKLRRLRQMQSAIDDLKKRGETMKSGPQRAKSDEEIRKRQAELKAAIEEYGTKKPTTPEQLANRERTRITAAKNAIEDLDLELRTGEEKLKSSPPPPGPELERLKAELNAMRALQKELKEAASPPDPAGPAQKALDAALIARERAAQRLDELSTGKRGDPPPAKEALTQLEEDIKIETAAMQKMAAEMDRELKQSGKPATHPAAKRAAAEIKRLREAIDNYDARRQAGNFTPKPKADKGYDATVDAFRKIRDARRKMYEAAKKAGQPVKSPEQRYNETYAKGVERRLAEAEARIKEGKFAPRPKKVQPQLTRANLDAKAKLEAKKTEIKQGEEQYRLAHRTAWEKTKERSLLVLQTARHTILGGDLGMLTRQGLFSWSRPLTAGRGVIEATKAAFSEESMARREVEIRDRVINGEAALPMRQAAGLQTSNTTTHPEELVITRMLSRIPDIQIGGKTIKLSMVGRAFERFQTTFINDVRTTAFDQGIKAGMSPEELARRASFINDATGIGNIKRVPIALAYLMTSPRYELSRWALLTQPPRNLVRLARGAASGQIDKAAAANLKDIGITVVGIIGLFKLAEAAGYSITWDPEDSDFLKMRKGNEVWDVSAGLAPRIRDVLRIAIAFLNPTYSKNIGSTLFKAAMRTINPIIKEGINQPSVAIQRARGVQEPSLPFDGYRSEEDREGIIALAPLIVQSALEAIRDEGPGAAASAAAREFIGQSVQRYPDATSTDAQSPLFKQSRRGQLQPTP